MFSSENYFNFALDFRFHISDNLFVSRAHGALETEERTMNATATKSVLCVVIDADVRVLCAKEGADGKPLFWMEDAEEEPRHQKYAVRMDSRLIGLFGGKFALEQAVKVGARNPNWMGW